MVTMDNTDTRRSQPKILNFATLWHTTGWVEKATVLGHNSMANARSPCYIPG